MPAVAGAGLVLGAGGMWAGERGGALPGGERAKVERVVHDYVLAHPEIIPQAMQKLQDRDTGRVIGANRAAIVTPIGDEFIGNPKGDVTLVEFFDYQCGFCRASLPTIAKLVERDPNLRVVFRDYPVLSTESAVAAQLGIAAARQGRFKRFHDALFAGGPVTQASMDAASRAAGIDPLALQRAAQAPQVADAIRANLALGRQLGMTGTPAWVVGDRVLSGALPIEDIERAIADARRGGSA